MKRTIIVSLAICFMAVIAWSEDQPLNLKESEGFIDVTGGKVWCRIVGDGARTPLLVLHGGPGVSSNYLKPLEALGTDRIVIFYDQLGGGKSPGPSDTTLWTIEHFVEEISQVREALGLKEVHLYGHSWGTMLAVDYLLTRPTGVKSLVLASPFLSAPRGIHDADSLLGTLPDSLQTVIRHHEQERTTASPEYQSALMVYYGTYFARRQPWSDELNNAFAELNQALYGYMWGPSEFTVTGILSDYDQTNRLGEITTPTLLTAGQFDYCVPATIKYYQSLIPNSEVVILENCAHLTMQDDPVADIKVIRDFLNKIESK